MRYASLLRAQRRSVRQLLALGSPADGVTVEGWVQRGSRAADAAFVHVSDGSSVSTLQAIVPKGVAASVPAGSIVRLTGAWLASSGRLQPFELHVTECRTLGKCKEFDRFNRITADELRTKPWLRARSAAFASMLRIRSEVARATHNFFCAENFVHIDTPLLTVNDCEGAGETFQVTPSGSGAGDGSFFAKSGSSADVAQPVFLTVSAQMHLESICVGVPRVYTMGTALRADRQLSRSHMSEFRMLEAEWAFCGNLTELCDLVERYVRRIVEHIQSLPDAELDVLAQIQEKGVHVRDFLKFLAPNEPFDRVTFQEALQTLDRIGKRDPGRADSSGLSRSEELALVAHCGRPVFVTNFPTATKPFYMKRCDDNDELTDSFDLLVPVVGELAGGSLRSSDVEHLKREAPPQLEWYVELTTYGKPPSAGFGIGFERLLQATLGIPNIKDTVAFPRAHKHCSC